MNKIKIICTLGPSSFKKNVLIGLKKSSVNIFRINMSHTSLNDLKKKIVYLKKNKIQNICIDTEGAQLRTTKVKKKFLLKKNKIIKICCSDRQSNNKEINIYPKFDLNYLNKKSKIFIGFENLCLEVKKNYNNKYLITKVLNEGFLESNKGVHISTNIKMAALTEKDIKALKIAKNNNIKHYAMSFVNHGDDVKELKKHIPFKSFIISKIETKSALQNLSKISDNSDALLIDRGDLSRYIPIEKIPVIQEAIAKYAKKNKIPLYVATNLLETMIKENNPTRAESHDIYSTIKQGVNGLVLAAETAIGKDPVNCVKFLKKCLQNFDDKRIKKLQNLVN